jgi:DeoR family fructose operon transcriptional repressor
MFAEERHQKIIALIEKRGKVEVRDISRELNVSEATVRRDLTDLEQKQLLKRTHGGAIAYSRTTHEATYQAREIENIDAKQAIAREAIKLIQPEEIILLDAGTTNMEIAKLLTPDHNVTVVTNAINIAQRIANIGLPLMMIGGELRPTTQAMVGMYSEMMLKEVYFDKLFLGTNGISLKQGLTTPNVNEAMTKRAMVGQAKQVIVVADSTKLGVDSFSKIVDLKSVDCLITDNHANEKLCKQISDQGIWVVRAN